MGEKTAEDAKIALAAISQSESGKEMVARGRDVVTGLPREVVITDSDVRDAVAPQVETIVDNVRSVLESTPPEVLADVMQSWETSAGHRKNMLLGKVREFGLARVDQNIWVMVLGKPGC